MNLCFFILSFFISSTALAYIPPSQFILEQVTGSHGKGSYQITQEVTINTSKKNYIYKETWWIESGRSMLVKIEAPHGVQHILYKGKKKYFIDRTGQLQAQNVPPSFFESLFHYRSLSLLKNDLTEKGILKPGQVRAISKFEKKEDITHVEEPFVKLARNRGTITYAIGGIENMAEIKPALWVEQDRFIIRRIRLQNNMDILADNYEDYSKKLSFPKSRTIRWGNSSAQIELMRVNLNNSKKTKDLLKTGNLSKLENTYKEYDPGSQIQEFFELFR